MERGYDSVSSSDDEGKGIEYACADQGEYDADPVVSMDMGNNLVDFLESTEEPVEVSKTECERILADFAAGASAEAGDAPVYEEMGVCSALPVRETEWDENGEVLVYGGTATPE